MKFFAVSSIAVLFAAQQVAAYPFIAGCLQNHTVTAVDSCTSLAAQYQITEADLYAMNPGLHHSAQHNCDNLDSGKNYCVCLKAPCPVQNAAVAPAASAATNATVSASAAVSSVASSISASIAPSSSPVVVASASSTSPSASTTPTPSNVTTAKSSATMTTTLSAITIGLVMTATTMLL